MTMWTLRTLAECVLEAPQDRGINVGLARDLARAALKADDDLREARHAPVSDPRGWEALTQQEAEQDARARDLAECEQDKSYIWHRLVTRRRERDEAVRERDAVAGQLAVAVRERDQARDALRKIAANPLLTLNRDIARAALAEGETVNQKPKGHTA